MVFYDMQEFGGLEEYAVTLAVGLQQQGHAVSALSAAWVPPENQYLRRLRENRVSVAQPPRWLSHPASHWPAKEKMLALGMWLLHPLVWLLGAALYLRRGISWSACLSSAQGWLRRQVMTRIIGPDRRRRLARCLLSWWRMRWRPELLHVHGYTTNLLFAIEWAHARRVPVVYEEHQTPDAQFDWWKGFQHSINKATIVVAVSEKSATALRVVCGVTRPVVVRAPLLPDPIGVASQGVARASGRAGPVRVATVARLYVTKGLTYLLEAAALVRQSHPDTEFTVHGEGALREELVAYARELGLDGEAIFVGAFTDRSELARIMARTDIFVMSSILEGQPLGLVEAMAYGCPIVATRVGGIPELINDGVNGLLCDPGDSTALAQRIQRLIDDPSLRRQLGHAARESYETGPFQPSSVCRHFISIYSDVLQGAPVKVAPATTEVV
jgi:glycosyltransferase involved in cell wall biosynthesis